MTAAFNVGLMVPIDNTNLKGDLAEITGKPVVTTARSMVLALNYTGRDSRHDYTGITQTVVPEFTEVR